MTDTLVEANPYLAGLFSPVTEERTDDDLEVIGEIPPDLDGVFVRNGPNPQFAPPGRYHWFDGDGMVHALRFRNGQASYRNRWIRTRAFERESAEHAPLFTGVMENPSGNPDLGLRLPLKDSANTDLVYFRDRVLATWYMAGEPYAIDPLTLETLGVDDFQGTRPCQVSAHAKVDEHTGELLFFDYSPVPPYMRYGVVGADGRLSHLVDIDLPGARLPHDMAATEHYSILMDLPLINDPVALRQGRHKILFDTDLPARFGVIPRRGRADEIRWFEADPCYVYHSVNAWEEGDEIVLDLCRVTKPAPREDAVGPLAKMLSYLRLDAHLYRYRFNLVTGATSEAYLDDDNTEFPTMDVSRLGRPTRYAYNMRISPEPSLLFDGIVKYDTQTGDSDRHWFGDGRWGSEAPFAPRTMSPGRAEDDGYLVSFVQDEVEQRSEVVVLDAADLGAGPVARVLLPGRVPIGFHAVWVRGDQLP
ncbi:MAG TPA: carotenoid oxygenase family protein [Acidimicrobiales bacterium]|nr:carotenoid oxygenase family protein [Acidimicrobiales bacterium]